MIDLKLAIAEALVRVFLGILFFFQGYDKLFVIKINEVVASFMKDAERRHIPHALVAFISYFTSIIEFLCGLLLIIGLFTNYALVLLGLDLIMIAFAFSTMQAMWDLKFVFPRLILLVILLILPPHAHFFSLDYLIHR
jgi:uncharacterized membrane protein YphA (DoxX/SURF4 family)